MRIVLLVDYRGLFWSSTKNVRTGTTMDLDRLAGLLRRAGHEVSVVEFADVDLTKDWTGTVVAYTSAEDFGLVYKSYIEDIVQALNLAGAWVLPDFPLLRAHHNKSFMEMLRSILLPDDPLAGTRAYGALEEVEERVSGLGLPLVVKPSSGAGSHDVTPVGSRRDLVKTVTRLTRSDGMRQKLREALLTRFRSGYRRQSTHRGKVVIQRLIPDLPGDFKVLVYGRRFFPVFRGNRASIATASGGGNLDFEVSRHGDTEALLTFASSVADQIGSPFLSLDIASTGGRLFLIEFQAVHFGPAALELASEHFVRRTEGGFERRQGAIGLEEAFADALVEAIAEPRRLSHGTC